VDTTTIHEWIMAYNTVMFTCQKCSHTWFPARAEPPRRCPNHACRSVLWNSIQHLKEPAPTLLSKGESHQEKLAAAFGLLREIEKPKPRPVQNSVLPKYAQAVDEWGEVIHNID
jgi:hypothetical protein